MAWHIRDAEPGDFEQVMALTERAYREFRPEVSAEFFDRFLVEAAGIHSPASPSETVVAEREGLLVGAVAVYRPGSGYGEGWPKDWAAIRLLAVDPAFRESGVGRGLLVECLERSRRLGAGGVGLHTTPFMHSARKLYRSLGFRPEPAFDAVDEHGVSVECYVLAL